MIRHLLRGGWGHTQDRQLDHVIGDHFWQLLHRPHLNLDFFRLEPLGQFHLARGLRRLLVSRCLFQQIPARLNIKRADDPEPLPLEAAIAEQRPAKVAHPHDHHRLKALCAEPFRDHLDQLLHIVTQSARAELPEVREILPQLSGLHTGRLGQHLAGHGVNAVVQQPMQAAQINRQPVNRLAGDFCSRHFFHRLIDEHHFVGHQQRLAKPLPRGGTRHEFIDKALGQRQLLRRWFTLVGQAVNHADALFVIG